MRLKPAGVLVSDGSSIRRFVDYDRPSGQRGNEIYLAHENLWSVGVYVDPELKGDSRVEQALVWLARKMGVRWEELSHRYSATPATWPEELLRHELTKTWPDADVELVVASPPRLRAGSKDTFAARLRTYDAALRARSARSD